MFTGKHTRAHYHFCFVRKHLYPGKNANIWKAANYRWWQEAKLWPPLHCVLRGRPLVQPHVTFTGSPANGTKAQELRSPEASLSITKINRSGHMAVPLQRIFRLKIQRQIPFQRVCLGYTSPLQRPEQNWPVMDLVKSDEKPFITQLHASCLDVWKTKIKLFSSKISIEQTQGGAGLGEGMNF